MGWGRDWAGWWYPILALDGGAGVRKGQGQGAEGGGLPCPGSGQGYGVGWVRVEWEWGRADGILSWSWLGEWGEGRSGWGGGVLYPGPGQGNRLPSPCGRPNKVKTFTSLLLR